MKLELIHEGLRFGSKEERILDKIKNDIILGVEYEFHLDVEEFYDIDEIEDLALEKVEEKIQEDISEALYEYLYDEVREFMNEYDFHSLSETVLDLTTIMVDSSHINSEDSDYFPQYLMKTYDELNKSMFYYRKNEKLDKWKSGINKLLKDERSFLLSVLDTFANIEEMITLLGIEISKSDIDFDISNKYLNKIFSAIDKVYGIDSRYLENDISFMKEKEFYSDIENNLGYNPNNPRETNFWDGAIEEARSLIVDFDDLAMGVTSHIEKEFKEVNKDRIHDIEEDSSVDHGVEVISKAIPMDKQFELMEEMFGLIRKIGSTSERTGMHVNMSIKGLDFSKNSFNPVKLLVLVSDKYYQIDKKYKPRRHTSPMFQNLKESDLFELAKIYKSDGIDAMAEYFISIGKFNKKSQAINFTHMETSISGTNRIEFRYFGGEGYERRYDELVKDIKYVAYCMMAAYSPTFVNKEYYKGLLKRLDSLVSDKVTETTLSNKPINSFLQLVSII